MLADGKGVAARRGLSRPQGDRLTLCGSNERSEWQRSPKQSAGLTCPQCLRLGRWAQTLQAGDPPSPRLRRDKTETAYEAAAPDKVARHTEVRYLTVGVDVNAAGISVKGVWLPLPAVALARWARCLTAFGVPGEISRLAVRLSGPRGNEMNREKSAEGIVGIPQAMLVRHSTADPPTLLRAMAGQEGGVNRPACIACRGSNAGR